MVDQNSYAAIKNGRILIILKDVQDKVKGNMHVTKY